jgi:hypothetical protein
MNAAALLVLSMMLTIGAPPGASPYSRVPASGPDDRGCAACPSPRRAKGGGWMRRENAVEGLKRYAMIAESIADEVEGDEQLARVMVVTVWGESGFRRDIHSGALRGDGGRSWGLTQIKIGRRPTQRLYRFKGLVARDLVGVTRRNTDNAIHVGATFMRRALKGCGKWARAECWWSHYSGGYYPMTHPPIVKRAKRYRRLVAGKLRTLTDAERAVIVSRP